MSRVHAVVVGTARTPRMAEMTGAISRSVDYRNETKTWCDAPRLPVANIPLLMHPLRSIGEAGITDARLVVDSHSGPIRSFLREATLPGGLKVLDQDNPYERILSAMPDIDKQRFLDSVSSVSRADGQNPEGFLTSVVERYMGDARVVHESLSPVSVDPDDTVLVLPGNLLSSTPLKEILDAHEANVREHGALATVGLSRIPLPYARSYTAYSVEGMPDRKQFGDSHGFEDYFENTYEPTVEGTSRPVTALHEPSGRTRDAQSPLVLSHIYAFQGALWNRLPGMIPADFPGYFWRFDRDLMPAIVQAPDAQGRVFSYLMKRKEFWMMVSDYARFWLANMYALQGKFDMGIPGDKMPGEQGWRHPNSTVVPSGSGERFFRASINENAKIGVGAKLLRNTVVGSYCQVNRNLEGCVLLSPVSFFEDYTEHVRGIEFGHPVETMILMSGFVPNGDEFVADGHVLYLLARRQFDSLGSQSLNFDVGLVDRALKGESLFTVYAHNDLEPFREW